MSHYDDAEIDRHLQALNTARLGLVLAQEMHREHRAGDTARTLEEAEQLYNTAYDWFSERGIQLRRDGNTFTVA